MSISWGVAVLTDTVCATSPAGGEQGPTLWVSSDAGVTMDGSAGFAETGTRGQLVTIAVTTARNVVSTLCVSLADPVWRSIESKMRCVMPIILSQTPPM